MVWQLCNRPVTFLAIPGARSRQLLAICVGLLAVPFMHCWQQQLEEGFLSRHQHQISSPTPLTVPVLGLLVESGEEKLVSKMSWKSKGKSLFPQAILHYFHPYTRFQFSIFKIERTKIGSIPTSIILILRGHQQALNERLVPRCLDHIPGCVFFIQDNVV